MGQYKTTEKREVIGLGRRLSDRKTQSKDAPIDQASIVIGHYTL